MDKNILIDIAYDLLYYGYYFEYFYKNYASKFTTEEQARELYNIALNKMEEL